MGAHKCDSTKGKVEPGAYDLVADAEVAADQATLLHAIEYAVGYVTGDPLFGEQSELAELSQDSLSTAISAAQSFFQNTYGDGVSSITIGGAVFENASPSIGSGFTAYTQPKQLCSALF